MTILVDHQIRALLPTLLPNADERDESLINPASLDIRVGAQVKYDGTLVDFKQKKIVDPDCVVRGYYSNNVFVPPGAFLLVSCFERIHVPNGMAMDLRLKSSRAREGWNHSLAFWVDPGWDGYLTMELQNISGHALDLIYGQRMAQVVLHRLDAVPEKPYAGRYQGATGVEGSKG